MSENPAQGYEYNINAPLSSTYCTILQYRDSMGKEDLSLDTNLKTQKDKFHLYVLPFESVCLTSLKIRISRVMQNREDEN
ncbi:hypothetical protein BEWA_013450 [Theileria equi strain WA]|uniref:Uncharacterized protein n=1 Tax=Theileria equi strain WA TaxID=1537102 RepID=L1LBU0_THEEQ|nr:hypothetical protein BEWA_013450 [Theileria equi strain WA]EKX72786.1 hypothetical protein BEWA_013450 [Theileria equi strain WA]|eukprot:XP_004832238.1 hypothetical protein BEWA_013450 [Theileria equi strain WA]